MLEKTPASGALTFACHSLSEPLFFTSGCMSSLSVWKPRWFSLTVTALSTIHPEKTCEITNAFFTSPARVIQKGIRVIGESASSVTPPEWNNGHVQCENLKA